MKLRMKVMLAFGLTFMLLLSASTVIIRQVVYGNLKQLERREVSSSVARLDEALSQQMRQLDVLTLDWANWDEMYDYVATQNVHFEEANLVQRSLQTADFNVVAVLKNNGLPLAYAQYSSNNYHFDRKLPAWAEMLVQRYRDDMWGGCNIVYSRPMLMQVCMRPIRPSVADKKTNGWLLTARELNADRLDSIQKMVKFPVEKADSLPVSLQVEAKEIWGGAGIAVREVGDYQYEIFRQLEDYHKQPVLWLKFFFKRESLQQTAQGFEQTLLIISLVTAGIFSLLYFWLDRLLVVRLHAIGSTLSEAKVLRDWQIAIPFVQDKDEIGELARDIVEILNEMTCNLGELKMESLEDNLTGLPNRRAFEQELAERWFSHQLQHRSITLMMLDIDYFKRFNDHFGHQRGDEVLALVARALKHSLYRESDFVGRYGGEEFVVILPETNEKAALAVAERLRIAIMDMGIEHLDSSHNVVTISVGAACVVPERGVRAADLLREADEALYNAKETGRNLVVARNLSLKAE